MKCICCHKKRKKIYNVPVCKFCYGNCPGHHAYCQKDMKYSKTKCKITDRTFWGNGNALCTGKKVHPANSSYIWKEVNCKACLKEGK